MAASRFLLTERYHAVWYTVASAVAAVPLMIWTYDSTYSLCRVNGSSMDPTLKHGDIVVVRKADWFPARLLQQPELTENGDGGDVVESMHAIRRWRERQQLLKWEQRHCQGSGTVSRYFQSPPTPLTGDVVVYKDPQRYPPVWNIKRVIGLGGQTVRLPMSLPESVRKGLTADERKQYKSMLVSSQTVSPYSIWVEGDNPSNSSDSRQSGDVCKNLVVGIAERIVWPPTRIGKIPQRPDNATTDEDDEMTNASSGNAMYGTKARAYWR